MAADLVLCCKKTASSPCIDSGPHYFWTQACRCCVLLCWLCAEFEGRDGGNDDDVDDEFDDDEEAVKGMARLFCEVAEAYIQLILAGTPEVRCVQACVCVWGGGVGSLGMGGGLEGRICEAGGKTSVMVPEAYIQLILAGTPEVRVRTYMWTCVCGGGGGGAAEPKRHGCM
jgi:hypothetical protein